MDQLQYLHVIRLSSAFGAHLALVFDKFLHHHRFGFLSKALIQDLVTRLNLVGLLQGNMVPTSMQSTTRYYYCCCPPAQAVSVYLFSSSCMMWHFIRAPVIKQAV